MGTNKQINKRSELYITSIEARLWRVSLLWRSGTTALQRWWLSDGASSNALSISSFAPMANPVAKQWCSRQARGHDSCPMIAIPCQCSSGRMKPSFGKANPQKLIVPLLLLVCHISLLFLPQQVGIMHLHV